MPLKTWDKEYVRSEIKNTPGIFVFGDNVARMGHAGQAIIRGLRNTLGIPTKWAPAKLGDCYFYDDQFDVVMRDHIRPALIELEMLLQRGNTVYWPTAGIGTGLAKWPEFAPRLLKEVNRIVEELRIRYE